jgi:hypothetical protein
LNRFRDSTSNDQALAVSPAQLQGFHLTGYVGDFIVRLRRSQRSIQTIPAAAVGGSAGFVSDLTGVGGGVFLTPLLIALGWMSTVAARTSRTLKTLFTFVVAFDDRSLQRAGALLRRRCPRVPTHEPKQQ